MKYYVEVAKRAAKAMRQDAGPNGPCKHYEDVAKFLEEGDEDRVIAMIAIVKHITEESYPYYQAWKTCPQLKRIEKGLADEESSRNN